MAEVDGKCNNHDVGFIRTLQSRIEEMTPELIQRQNQALFLALEMRGVFHKAVHLFKRNITIHGREIPLPIREFGCKIIFGIS